MASLSVVEDGGGKTGHKEQNKVAGNANSHIDNTAHIDTEHYRPHPCQYSHNPQSRDRVGDVTEWVFIVIHNGVVAVVEP